MWQPTDRPTLGTTGERRCEGAVSRRALHSAVWLLVLICAAGPAFAQVVPAGTVLVSQKSSSTITDIQTGINEAVDLYRETGELVGVWIDGLNDSFNPVTYTITETIYIPADVDLWIRGYPFDRPWDVVIDGGGLLDAVLTIHTDYVPLSSNARAYQFDPTTGDSNELARLVIENLMIRNAQYGVRIFGEGQVNAADARSAAEQHDDPPVRPTLSRCVVLGMNGANHRAGVWIEDNAAPLLVNCSIGGYQLAQGSYNAGPYNSLQGIHVAAPTWTLDPDWYTDILHCTILLNENHGVYVETGANARVRNSLIYRNGDGLNPIAGDAQEGGLVWETDLFITPTVAPYDVPAPTDPPLVGGINPNAVAVMITGNGLFLTGAGDLPSETRVFFGPPDRPETEWFPHPTNGIVGSGTQSGEQTLTGYLPASYLGAPGPVDVHVIRKDGLEHFVKHGFTYVENATDAPQVAQVVPESGPVITTNAMDPSERRGNWVHIYGVRFEQDCEVYFDTNSSLGPRQYDAGLDARSERVMWLSSSRLYAKVPDLPDPSNPPTGKIDVFVVNPDSGLVSPAGPLAEYEFVTTVALPRPSIAEISPNYFRDVEGTADADSAATTFRVFTVDIMGWNFGPSKQLVDSNWQPMPVIVKIGGIVCPYDPIIDDPSSTTSATTNGIWQGQDDANGDSFDEVRNVIVPISEFGVGGTYDVEVINFDGQSAVLPKAFTYYADSTPDLEPDTLDLSGDGTVDFSLPWRPADFARESGGPDVDRRLLGSSFDTGLEIRFTDTSVPTTKTIDGRLDTGVLPDEQDEEHISHTQRQIDLSLPDTAQGILNAIPPCTATELDVTVENVLNVQEDSSEASTNIKTVTTQFHWLDVADYFEIVDVEEVAGWPADDTDPGSTAANYCARMQVTNWDSTMQVFLGGVEIIDGVPGSGTGRILEDSGYVYFHLYASEFPQGQYGPQDVVLVNTSNRYWVAEEAVWVPRLNGGVPLAPTAYAVTPRTVEEVGGEEIRLSGVDFIGYFDGDTMTPKGSYTRISIYTDVNADWDGDGNPDAQIPVPLIAPDDVSTDTTLLNYLSQLVNNGDITAIADYVTGVTDYDVRSSTELRFTLGDLSTLPVWNLARDFPRNTPLDIRVEHVGPTGVVLTDSTGLNPLAYDLREAIVLLNAPAKPEIEDVYRLDLGPVVVIPPVAAGLNENERQALISTLATLGFETIELPSSPAPDADTWLTNQPEADVYVSHIGQQPGVSGPSIGTWVGNGHGSVQISPDGPDFNPLASAALLATDTLTITPADLTHPLSRSLPASWAGAFGYGQYIPSYNVSYATAGTSLASATVSGGGPTYTHVVVASAQGSGFAADLGWNVYGASAGAEDVLMLRNALDWAGRASNQRQRWGTVLGGDIVAIEGTNFNVSGAADTMPRVCFGGAEARVLQAGEVFTTRDGRTFTAPPLPDWVTNPNGLIYVVTPPAPQGLPGTVDVKVVTEYVSGADTWLLEGFAPDDRRYLYVMDGQPYIEEIRPNYVDRDESNARTSADDAVYFTILGHNFDNQVQVRFYVDVDDDGVADDIDGSGIVDEDDVIKLTHFSVSPYEIVVVAPGSDDLPTDALDPGFGLTDTDYTVGSSISGTWTQDMIRVLVEVRNLPIETPTDADTVTSNALPVFYIDQIDPLEPRTPELAFNDVYLNYADYVNTNPGTGSISVDPLLDPGPTNIHMPSGMMLTTETLGTPEKWWLGKLAMRTGNDDAAYDNPIRDKAGMFVEPPYTSEDLEYEDRPNESTLPVQGTGRTDDALPDIGADEVGLYDGFGELRWYFAMVGDAERDAANQLIPKPVGRKAAGELGVFLQIRGLTDSLKDGTGIPSAENRVFIVPQGGDPANTDHRIRITLMADYGGGYYYGVNADPIDTVLWRPSENRKPDPSERPEQGDIVADGHAYLCIDLPAEVWSGGYRTVLGDDPADLSDGGVIYDQAKYGRHFLIDTIPPRIHIETYHSSYYVEPGDFITYHNDIWTSNDADAANHPFPLPPAAGVYVKPPTYAAPTEDNGYVINPFRSSGDLDIPDEKPQVFFNTGSISNGLPQDDLEFTVEVEFIDPPVMEVLNAVHHTLGGTNSNEPIAGANSDNTNEDVYTGLVMREVSGFEASTPGASTDVDVLQGSEVAWGQARWVIDADTRAVLVDATPDIAGTFVPGDYSTDMSSDAALNTTIQENWGFVRDQANQTMSNPNTALAATWELTGLDWAAARDDLFHLPIRFQAYDRAGNPAVLDEDNLLNALHVWWNLNAETHFTGASPAEKSETTRPTFRWEISPSVGLTTVTAPKPVFMYRLFWNTTSEYNGLYTPLTGWSTWSDANTYLNPSDIRNAIVAGGGDPDTMDFWILVVVQGADEFGNVEPWYRTEPGTGLDLFDPPNSGVDFRESSYPSDPGRATRMQEWAVNLPNWRRFLWPGLAKPETKLSAVFWYGNVDGTLHVGDTTDWGGEEARLGPNPLVPMPPENTGLKVEAQFRISAKFDQVLDPDSQKLVAWWQFVEDGELIDQGFLDLTSGHEVVLPYDYVTISYDTSGHVPEAVDEDLGDIDRKRPTKYVFRAAVFVDGSNGFTKNTEYDEGEMIDPTWSNVDFVVTPYAGDPKVEPGRQPVITTEEL